MKRLVCSLTLTLLAASISVPASLSAQTSSSSSSIFSFDGSSASFGGSSLAPARGEINNPAPAPFSRLALSGGIGSMGINMQAAVNANRYFNIRGTGNYFGYNVSNVTHQQRRRIKWHQSSTLQPEVRHEVGAFARHLPVPQSRIPHEPRRSVSITRIEPRLPGLPHPDPASPSAHIPTTPMRSTP